MGTRFRLLAAVLLSASLLVLSACSSGNNSTTSSGTGALYITTQGDSLVTGFTIDLSTGVLSANGSGVATGNTPSAMIMSPSGAALFVSNSAANAISAYTVKSDGTLAAASGTTATGMTPVGMAIDSGDISFSSRIRGSRLMRLPAASRYSRFRIRRLPRSRAHRFPPLRRWRLLELGRRHWRLPPTRNSCT